METIPLVAAVLATFATGGLYSLVVRSRLQRSSAAHPEARGSHQLEPLRAALARAEAERDALAAALGSGGGAGDDAELLAELARTRDEVARLCAELATAPAAREHERRAERLEAEVAELRRRAEEAEEAERRARAAREQAGADRDREVVTLKRELGALRASHGDLSQSARLSCGAAVEHLAEVDAALERAADLQAELAHARARVAEAESEAVDLRRDRERLRHELAALRAPIADARRLDGVDAATERAAREAADHAVAEPGVCPPATEPRVETAAEEGDMQVSELVAKLERELEATYAQLETTRAGTTAVAEELADVRALFETHGRKLERELTAVREELETTHAALAVARSHSAEREEARAELERELELAREELDDSLALNQQLEDHATAEREAHEHQVAELEGTLAAARGEAEDLEVELESERECRREQAEHLERVQADLDRASAAQAQALERAAALEEALDVHRAELTRARAEAERARSRGDDASARLRAAESRSASLEDARATLRAELERSRAAARSAGDSLARAQAEALNLGGLLQCARDGVAALEARLADVDRERSDERRAAHAALQATEDELARATERVAVAEADRDRARESYRQLSGRLRTSDTQLEDLRKRAAALAAELVTMGDQGVDDGLESPPSLVRLIEVAPDLEPDLRVLEALDGIDPAALAREIDTLLDAIDGRPTTRDGRRELLAAARARLAAT